jgi:hypothetical protein
MTAKVIAFPVRRQGKSEKMLLIVRLFIAKNHSLLIGTSNPQLLYDQLCNKFPEAKFKIVEFGVELCKKQ